MKKKIIISFNDSMHGSGSAAQSIYESDKKKSELICLINGDKMNFKFGFLKIIAYLVIQFFQQLCIFLIYGKLHEKKSLNIINFNFLDFNNYLGKIININWINNDFVSLSQISRIRQKTLITLHDLWITNTVFHHDGIKYKKNFFTKKIDKLLIKNKQKILSKDNLLFIVPSIWMKKKILGNNLILNNSIKKKVEKNLYVIPNYGEEKIFFPINTYNKNQFPQNIKKFLFFYNNSLLKGGDLVFKFLKFINNNSYFGNSIIYLVGNTNASQFYKKFENLNFKFYKFVPRDKLVYIYNQVNFTCIFSRAESFSLVALESLFSGTPVLSFKYLALNEFVKHKKNGFLINDINEKEILNFVMWHKKKNLEKNQIRKSVLKKFNSKVISKKWKSIYDIASIE